MTKSYRSVLLFIISASSTIWAANAAQFAIKGSHQDSNGVTLQTAGGAMRIEACGERVIHIIASPTGEFPHPKVPVVIEPCHASNLVVKAGKKDMKVSTAA